MAISAFESPRATSRSTSSSRSLNSESCSGTPASDASFYKVAGIPSVVYGPGELRLAHCKDENVLIDEVIAAARGLAACVLDWSAVAEQGGA